VLVLAGITVAVPFAGPIPGSAQAQTPVPPGPQPLESNPEIADSCGIDVTLVLDASGSIQSSNAVDDVRDAAEAFLDALADTGSYARVTQFATFSAELAAREEVTAAAVQNGNFRTAINKYYNPKPPRPLGVNIYNYRGSGSPLSISSWSSANSSNQYTNWDQSLRQAGEGTPTELVLYITDGDPTSYDFDQPGDPFRAGPPDVGVNTYRGDARATTLDRAVQEANEIKLAGTRMLAVGVGSALSNPTSRSNLVQIAGPQVVTDSDLNKPPTDPTRPDGINEVDVALVQDFDKLATFLRSVVSELCSPSLSIRKLAQSADSADYLPAAGWDITVTPTVTGGTYEWILPDTDPDPDVLALCGNPADPLDQAPRACTTDDTGLANFQWEPDPEDSITSAVVEERVNTGWIAGRPNPPAPEPPAPDWQCTLKNEDGTEEIEAGDFGQGAPTFNLDVDPQQIITCNIYNSFVYEPGIDLVKVDTPVQVRGDLGDPDSVVTSTFTVTNTGNAALNTVELSDDKCTPVYQSGDVGGDGILDNSPAETWTYTCTRVLTSSPGTNPTIVTNTASVNAVDPAGTAVSDTATARVAVYAPAITLTKTPSVPTVNLNVATPVTYTYVARNTGNMTLTNVAVKDDLGPSDCSPVTPVSPATPPITLAPGASQTFTCATTLTATTTDPIENIADVVGTPQFPTTPPSGITGPNGPVGPDVRAQAPAVVGVVDAQLNLTKVVDKPLIFPNTEVTYTYTVANPGNVALQRPGGFGTPPSRDGWIDDSDGPTGTCSPVTYESGDGGTAFVLDPDETWTYTCSTTLGAAPTRVVNTAEVVAEPVAGGDQLTRRDQAVVDVVSPAIEIVKAAVRPVVLDDYGGLPLGDPPGPIAGPDVPSPTPAAYTFTVSNTGNVPIRDVAVTDDFPNNATTSCTPNAVLSGADNVGDTNTNSVLDPGEAWEYNCAVALTKADDADGAPVARDQIAVVTNRASVTGEAFLGQERPFPVTDTSSDVQVQIISPEARITKIPCTGDPAGTLACRDDLVVRPGTDVTYRYELSNVGDTTLDPLGLVDDRCDGITYVGGDTNGDGLVEGGAGPEVWEYRCTATINGPDAVVNTVDVFAVGPLGNLYADEATATVRVFDPAINLVKTARESLVPVGTPVTYDFVVTNVGTSSLPADDVLAQITLADVGVPAIPECNSPTPVDVDQNGNDLLDRDETWRYECTATINADTVNLALVTGVGGTQLTPPLPVDVFDLSAAFVGVFQPAIEVTKTANPTSVLESGDVTYSYEVRNTGDVPLAEVDSRIVDDKCSPVTYVSGDLDEDGLLDSPDSIFEDSGDEVWIFTCTTRITTDTTNVVTVTGTPTDPDGSFLCGNEPVGLTAALIEPCDVTDTATAVVTVQRRGSITIVKDAEPDGPTPFGFSGTLGAFELVDDGSARNARTFPLLAPGTYTVAESATAGWSLESIVCVDPTNDTTVSLLTGTATIQLGTGETITCTFRNIGPAVVPPLPPLPPSPELPATGLAIGGPALLAGLALLGFGLLLSSASRRRRTA
jgi:uncharacterized repeat protein (TIGR01451 family)